RLSMLSGKGLSTPNQWRSLSPPETPETTFRQLHRRRRYRRHGGSFYTERVDLSTDPNRITQNHVTSTTRGRLCDNSDRPSTPRQLRFSQPLSESPETTFGRPSGEINAKGPDFSSGLSISRIESSEPINFAFESLEGDPSDDSSQGDFKELVSEGSELFMAVVCSCMTVYSVLLREGQYVMFCFQLIQSKDHSRFFLSCFSDSVRKKIKITK
ncbi:hypothetical protein F5883DRAFT_579827, partial [Diaporthe sp. PMI_573]